MTDTAFTLKARTGRAFRLPEGGRVKVTNTFGSQVVDTWAFKDDNLSEYMSMEHTRVHVDTPVPKAGTVLVSTQRRAILEMVEDTSPGVHDWFFAACDRYRYAKLGVPDHANCADNLRMAMRALGKHQQHVPCPLNLFQNCPVTSGDINIYPPVSKPGDFVVLEAKMDVIMCLSACPQDLADTNGAERTPRDCEIELIL